MARVTINKVNERINQYGFELVRGVGYYYFSRVSDSSPIISQDGIYGSPFLNAWTVDQLEKILVERIINDASDTTPNIYVGRAYARIANHSL